MRLNGRATALAQVHATAQRVFQPLVGFVDADGPLHGQTLGYRTFTREFVRMGFAQKRLPLGVEGCKIKCIALRQAKQRKVGGIQVNIHGALSRPTAGQPEALITP